MANHYTVEKEINGVKYIAQYAGIQIAAEAADKCRLDDGSGAVSVVKMADFLFKHIVVEPKNLTLDDFETMEELNEVTAFARDVMQGKFRDKFAKQAKTKEKG